MTSELNYYEIKALRILNGDETDIMGAWFNSCCEVLKSHGYVSGVPYQITKKGKKYISAADNTRAVPDVPELLVVAKTDTDELANAAQGFISSMWARDIEGELPEIELVAKDQAAAVIAAKDSELTLKDTGLKIAVSKIAALEAKLNQIEKQEAVDGFLMSDGVAYVHQQYGEGLFFSDDALKPIYVTPIQRGIPQDVINLVIAGRELAYGAGANISSYAYNVFDKALEAFASRVSWENEPDEDAALNPSEPWK